MTRQFSSDAFWEGQLVVVFSGHEMWDTDVTHCLASILVITSETTTNWYFRTASNPLNLTWQNNAKNWEIILPKRVKPRFGNPDMTSSKAKMANARFGRTFLVWQGSNLATVRKEQHGGKETILPRLFEDSWSAGCRAYQNTGEETTAVSSITIPWTYEEDCNHLIVKDHDQTQLRTITWKTRQERKIR